MKSKKLYLSRDEAINLIAYVDMLGLTYDQRESILIDWLDEDEKSQLNDDTNIYSADFNKYVISYLSNKFLGVKNEFLAEKVSTIFNTKVLVEGENDVLNRCFCCGYLTIEDRGNYEICRVCFWEDDGSKEKTKYSSVNSMTLEEAQKEFVKIGAISERLKEFVDPEGKQKFVN